MYIRIKYCVEQQYYIFFIENTQKKIVSKILYEWHATLVVNIPDAIKELSKLIHFNIAPESTR